MSITKTGVWTSPTFTNYLASNYDPIAYYEPDGSAWIHIFHHNDPSTQLFNSTNNFITKVYLDEDRWFNISLCNAISENWELMIVQKQTTTSAEQKWRWIQNENPMVATFEGTKTANIIINTDSEYSAWTANFGGIGKWYASKTYLTQNSNKSSQWFGATGSWTAYEGGTPGYHGIVVTTGYMDLYLRIDNIVLTHASINEGGTMSPQFIEL